MQLLRLHNTPILEQLQIEEALLRADTGDWCLINSGSPPAIVMGISGIPEKLLHVEKVKKDRIPLIKRYSGGGTVFVDPETIFVTFICNTSTFEEVAPNPKAIMQWSEGVYKPFFPNFSLRENDYVFGERKFGGNAQYIQKGRWLHHTSFLWNFDPKNMEYLRLPEKRPTYRGERSHADFLCTLSSAFSGKEQCLSALEGHLRTTLSLKDGTWNPDLLHLPHRKSTVSISL